MQRSDTGRADEVRQPSRRAVLAGAAAATLVAPFIRPARAAERSLKVATFGGNFENSFVKYLYPEFEKATGIKVDSVSEPGGIQFLIQVEEANRAGQAPIDVCTGGQADVVRGSRLKLWRNFDLDKIPNHKLLADRFIHRNGAGVDGIGAMSWYQSLIVNPKVFKTLPTSWKILWEAGHPNAWGLSGGGDTDLFEITAATWFDGNASLATEEGILKVLAKIAELKPNVHVWWESEGTMQTAYENDEVIGGMYYHDVAGVMAKSGVPVVSIFPKEGAVIDFGSWCQPAASTKVAEAEEFVNFMISAKAQAMMTRNIGTAPLIDRALTDLTPAEFAAVSGDVPPISIAVEQRLEHLDFMDAQFTKMLTS
jgi:putative spermidine/putrescine transport system substrate-binding protein